MLRELYPLAFEKELCDPVEYGKRVQERIKELKEKPNKKEYTIESIARKASLLDSPIDRNVINRIINNSNKSINLKHTLQLAYALECSPHYLLGKADTPNLYVESLVFINPTAGNSSLENYLKEVFESDFIISRTASKAYEGGRQGEAIRKREEKYINSDIIIEKYKCSDKDCIRTKTFDCNEILEEAKKSEKGIMVSRADERYYLFYISKEQFCSKNSPYYCKDYDYENFYKIDDLLDLEGKYKDSLSRQKRFLEIMKFRHEIINNSSLRWKDDHQEKNSSKQKLYPEQFSLSELNYKFLKSLVDDEKAVRESIENRDLCDEEKLKLLYKRLQGMFLLEDILIVQDCPEGTRGSLTVTHDPTVDQRHGNYQKMISIFSDTMGYPFVVKNQRLLDYLYLLRDKSHLEENEIIQHLHSLFRSDIVKYMNFQRIFNNLLAIYDNNYDKFKELDKYIETIAKEAKK